MTNLEKIVNEYVHRQNISKNDELTYTAGKMLCHTFIGSCSVCPIAHWISDNHDVARYGCNQSNDDLINLGTWAMKEAE